MKQLNLPCYYKCPKKQRGALLIVSLIILMMLSTLGVSVMRNSTLEEKMASNTLHKERAFQSAETVVEHSIKEKSSLTAAMNATPNPVESTVDLGHIAIESSAKLYYIKQFPAVGSSLSKLVFHKFVVIGEGKIDQANTKSQVIQGVQQLAPVL